MLFCKAARAIGSEGLQALAVEYEGAKDADGKPSRCFEAAKVLWALVSVKGVYDRDSGTRMKEALALLAKPEAGRSAEARQLELDIRSALCTTQPEGSAEKEELRQSMEGLEQDPGLAGSKDVQGRSNLVAASWRRGA